MLDWLIICTKTSQLESRLGYRREKSGFRLIQQDEPVYEITQNLFNALYINALEKFKAGINSYRGQPINKIHIGMLNALVINSN